VTHPLPLRSSEVIKQHAISEAEYEFELIRQSTEERHQRMKVCSLVHVQTIAILSCILQRPSGRGGVGNSYLYTPSKSPKFSVFGARAVSPQTSPSIVAQSTAFQHRSPGAPTNAPQDERRTWLKLRLGRRLERKECPIQTYTGVTPVTRTSVLDISPIKSYPRQSLATLDIRAYDNPDDMHGDPISPEFSEDGCSNRHSYNFRPRQRSHSIASSTVSITGYDHDPAEFSHHRLAEFVRSMNTTPTLPLYRLDASSDPTLPLSTRASAGSSSAGYTRIGTHLLVEDHDEDGAITYEAEDDTDGENGSDFEAGASLYASSFPIHASALASVPNSTPNSTASSPIISPPDPYPFPNSTSPILRNVPIRRNPEQSRIVRRKRHFGLTPVA
jgi:hypothetical protein